MNGLSKPKFFLAALLRGVHALSLEVAFLALGWQWGMARSFGVSYSWQHAVVLGLSIVLVYLGDHILDIKKTPALSSLRYQWIKQHPKFTGLLFTGTLSLNITCAILFLTPHELIKGLILLGLTALYIWKMARSKAFPMAKEVGLALIFTGGLFLFLERSEGVPIMAWLQAFTLLFLLFFTNTALIAHYDRDEDIKHNRSSLAIHHPGSYSILRHLALGIAALGAIYLPWKLALFVATSGTGLYSVHFLKTVLTKEKMRIACDGVLFSPLLGLLLFL